MAGKYTPQENYDKENTKKFTIKLNLKTDADIIEYLGRTGNKQGTIKRLIREAIEKEQA